MNAWTITRDCLAETITRDYVNDPAPKPGTNCNAIGIVGPSRTTLTAKQIAEHPDAKPFRMLDDDGILYYEGFLIGDEFAPLDDFGEPNAGCTRIQIQENGAWIDVV